MNISIFLNYLLIKRTRFERLESSINTNPQVIAKRRAMANHVGRVEESKCYHYLITLSPITWDIIKIVSVTLPPYGVHVTKTRTRED